MPSLIFSGSVKDLLWYISSTSLLRFSLAPFFTSWVSSLFLMDTCPHEVSSWTWVCSSWPSRLLLWWRRSLSVAVKHMLQTWPLRIEYENRLDLHLSDLVSQYRKFSVIPWGTFGSFPGLLLLGGGSSRTTLRSGYWSGQCHFHSANSLGLMFSYKANFHSQKPHPCNVVEILEVVSRGEKSGDPTLDKSTIGKEFSYQSIRWIVLNLVPFSYRLFLIHDYDSPSCSSLIVTVSFTLIKNTQPPADII